MHRRYMEENKKENQVQNSWESIKKNTDTLVSFGPRCFQISQLHLSLRCIGTI